MIGWTALALVALAALVIAHRPAAWLGEQARETVAGGNEPPAPREPPTSESLDPRALEAAAAYAGARRSLALIVSRHGYIVFEKYWQGTNFDTPVDSGALARVLTALAAGAAVSDRSIGWPEEPIGNFMPEWQKDPRGTITVLNLLQLSSGLAPASTRVRSDLLAQYLQRPLAAKPGDRWLDQSVDPELLAHVIEVATRRRYSQYLSSAIWSRIGAADASLWVDHPGGAAHVDRGFIAHQGDWIRVAELLLTNGRYQGAEVLMPRWIAQLLQPARANNAFGSYIRLGTHTAAGMTPYEARDVLLIQGGGNRLWIIPSMQLAILRTSDSPDEASATDWDDGRIPNLIVRGARDFVPAAAQPGADLRQLVPNH